MFLAKSQGLSEFLQKLERDPRFFAVAWDLIYALLLFGNDSLENTKVVVGLGKMFFLLRCHVYQLGRSWSVPRRSRIVPIHSAAHLRSRYVPRFEGLMPIAAAIVP
jgi:hypothetical protein